MEQDSYLGLWDQTVKFLGGLGVGFLSSHVSIGDFDDNMRPEMPRVEICQG